MNRTIPRLMFFSPGGEPTPEDLAALDSCTSIKDCERLVEFYDNESTLLFSQFSDEFNRGEKSRGMKTKRAYQRAYSLCVLYRHRLTELLQASF